jgi:hypothetical protein
MPASTFPIMINSELCKMKRNLPTDLETTDTLRMIMFHSIEKQG